eukprot:CAMPEP_0197850950 /NCGR_PEP_ID=MMETSP1438-20131217/16853_1 /TAXON_ID=1461541 /ORGANISM="Pterosperma sp., Strain CCMP1384" /LENGTH=370 /DNA_ID=CAMNT_0043464377 /DNA_START=90 /DNA_END=1202 /DNA_ORIENTATION=+
MHADALWGFVSWLKEKFLFALLALQSVALTVYLDLFIGKISDRNENSHTPLVHQPTFKDCHNLFHNTFATKRRYLNILWVVCSVIPTTEWCVTTFTCYAYRRVAHRLPSLVDASPWLQSHTVCQKLRSTLRRYSEPGFGGDGNAVYNKCGALQTLLLDLQILFLHQTLYALVVCKHENFGSPEVDKNVGYAAAKYEVSIAHADRVISETETLAGWEDTLTASVSSLATNLKPGQEQLLVIELNHAIDLIRKQVEQARTDAQNTRTVLVQACSQITSQASQAQYLFVEDDGEGGGEEDSLERVEAVVASAKRKLAKVEKKLGLFGTSGKSAPRAPRAEEKQRSVGRRVVRGGLKLFGMVAAPAVDVWSRTK